MPTYGFRCENGHYREFVASIKSHIGAQDCAECGLLMERVIFAPILVAAQPECRYDSPIDGTPITSWAQRREDLAKHGCAPYDPEQKTDFDARLKAEDAALDRSIDAHVEEAIEKMPTAKRADLYHDLIDKGATMEYARITPEGG